MAGPVFLPTAHSALATMIDFADPPD